LSDNKTMPDGMNLGSDSPDKLIGYPISISRFVGYTVLSLGLFKPVWAYKHYRYFFDKPGIGGAITAAVFAIFLPISFHGLMDSYNRKSALLEHPLALKKLFLSVSYFALIGSSKVVGHFKVFLLAAIICELTSLLPLIAFQRKVNELNRALRPDLPFAEPMTAAKWIGLGIGVFIFFVILIVFAMVAGPGRDGP
jgi:hypothetical protein